MKLMKTNIHCHSTVKKFFSLCNFFFRNQCGPNINHLMEGLTTTIPKQNSPLGRNQMI